MTTKTGCFRTGFGCLRTRPTERWRRRRILPRGTSGCSQYDALGNLLSVGLPNGDLVEYLVDGMGRRVGKKKNGVLLKQWVYRDALKPVAELDANGNLVAEFVYASKGHVPDYVVRGGTTYRVLADQLGTARYAVNVADSSDVPYQADYSSFGEVSGIGLDWMPFGFAGGQFDVESNLVRFGMRDCLPEAGRWTAKDAIRFNGGDANLMIYALQDPVNLLIRSAPARGTSQNALPKGTVGPNAGMPNAKLRVKTGESFAARISRLRVARLFRTRRTTMPIHPQTREAIPKRGLLGQRQRGSAISGGS